MFAPLVTKATTRVRTIQRSIGSQATLKELAQQATGSVRDAAQGRNEQENRSGTPSASERTPGGPWNFIRVSLYPHDTATRLQGSSLQRPIAPLSGAIQAKLVLGQANDPLENEADHVADRVMYTQTPSPVGSPPWLSGKRAICAEELHRNVVSPITNDGSAPRAVHQVLTETGRSLDAESLAFFEPHFGLDLSHVRIHDDSRAAISARVIGARAYTMDSHIVFAHGQYRPSSAEGRRLLAHELMHTLQQRKGTPAVRRQPDPVSQVSSATGHADLDRALDAHEWSQAAEILNGYNPDALQAVLAKLKRGQIASIHAGALDNPKVGPDSRAAQVTRAAYLDINYENELKRHAWSAAAKYLNGFNRDDIRERIQKLDITVKQAIFDGAVANPDLGDKSPVAEITAMLIAQQKSASTPVAEVFETADTIQHKGDPLTDTNYIEKSTKGIGIPIWGGPFFLKQTDTPGWDDCVVVPRSDVFFVDPLARQVVEIQSVYRTRQAALMAVQKSGLDGAYSFYQGEMGRIVPTIVSATTAPAMTHTAQLAIKGEARDAKAAEQLSTNLLIWYVGARLPVKVGGESAATQAVRSSLQDILGETEYAAVKAAAEVAKAAHPELASLTTDEIIAIRAYSDQSWSYLNAALRLKDAKELTRLEQFINLMKSGIAKLPIFKGTVTRTVAIQTAEAAQKYKAGATIVEDAFTSTTFGKAVAQREGNVLLTIESQTGRDITAAAAHNESEVLFAPGTKFLITQVQQVSGAFLIWMKEIL